MIFLGPMYDPQAEKEILKNSARGISNASNQYQMDLLKGFLANGSELKIVNVLPVGTWPRQYAELKLPDREWKFEGARCCEAGCINLPVIKQWQREIKVGKLLKKLAAKDREIVVYSAYLPFLRAARKLPESVRITLIVTDLPEYYDLGRTSFVRRILRGLNNRIIHQCLQRVDRYVLLTEQMKERLPVQGKPYTVVEGIWSGKADEGTEQSALNRRKVVFYAGTLHRKFGVMNLVEAFSTLEDEEAELWLCGAGDCAEEIEERAKKDSRIRYFGYVSSEKAAEMRKQATLLVNPRTNEGEYTKYSFPSKTMGYMASGKPVVMYRLDGIPREYDRYLIYPEDNTVESLKMTIHRVLSLPDSERRELGERGQRFIMEQKNAALQVRKILDLMND